MAGGTVYLLHFDRPYGHAGHYTGWTTDLTTRLAEHAAGHGARLLAVARAAGIGWTLARTWTGSRVASTANLYHPGSRFELTGRFTPQEIAT